MPKRLSCRLDRELSKSLEHYAKSNGLTLSQATRELMRQVLTDAEPISRGWREGMAKGYAEAQKAHQAALSGIVHK